MQLIAPVLSIDLSSPTPAYQQIVAGLRMFLVEGRFQPGDQLPTVRQLAADLGVHHNTVAEAYRLLAEEGWLDLRRGRGAVVQSRSGPVPNQKARAEFARRLRELIAQALAEGISKRAIAGEWEMVARNFNLKG